MPAWKGIVGRSFSPAEFAVYLEALEWGAWIPEFLVLHHTAVPSLAQRPQGLTHQHIVNLESYYRDENEWSAGPHLFVDDRQIWVFTPLTTPGVHAKSFNAHSLGLEMLGNYDHEPFDSGRGLLVRRMAIAALGALSAVLGLDPGSLRFHRDEPSTSKTCPGRLVDKAQVVQEIRDYIDRNYEDVPIDQSIDQSIDQPVEPEAPAPSPAPIGVPAGFDPQEIPRARERLPIIRASIVGYEWPAEVVAALEPELGPEWLVWILAGILSRESRFGLLLDENGLGDHGHGHGELQIDDRWHKAFCDSGLWQDLGASLDYALRSVIAPAFNDLGDHCDLDYGPMFWATIAAYNAGAGGVSKALAAGQDPDAATTGRNYSQDVRARARALKEVLS
jgi:hypothetical protein